MFKDIFFQKSKAPAFRDALVITVNEGQEGCAGFAQFSTFRLGMFFGDSINSRYPKTADAYMPCRFSILVRLF